LNILKVDFQDLYQRHLCRHSQLGINIGHLVLVLAIYAALGGFVYALGAPDWILLVVIVPYLAILAFNIPLRVFLLNALFVGMLFLACLALPRWPLWSYPLAILVFYKLQAWSHKIYTHETDMTEFDKRYPKGIARFVLLSVYELPILVHYLFFGKKDWARSDGNSSNGVRDLAIASAEKVG